MYGASHEMIFNPILLTKRSEEIPHNIHILRLGSCRILVIVIFSIFSQDICFLFRITQVALFSVYTSLPLYNWWPHKYLSQPRLISFQARIYSSLQFSLSQDCFQCQHHCITVSYLMTLKCHISSRKQIKHKKNGI